MLDGWWVEGWVEGVTGWAIDGGDDVEYESWIPDADALYGKLRRAVVPTYYQHRAQFLAIMRAAIARNGARFNTHRMVQEYVSQVYYA